MTSSNIIFLAGRIAVPEEPAKPLAVFGISIFPVKHLIRKKHPQIGLATVYRTMRVICDAGLARETDFGGGIRCFEHKYKHQHHHHLICLKCGKIEEIQRQLAKKHGFTIVRDTMEIFGICRTCKCKEK